MAFWAACWAAAAVAGAEPPRSGEDIAWVWDHHAPPAACAHWAPTVQHVLLREGGVSLRGRQQALGPLPERVTPVIHVQQAPKVSANALTREQQQAIQDAVLRAAAHSRSGWVQLDFEARPRQRETYHALVRAIRSALPANLRLSVTVLAWQCRSADWIAPLVADEVVPMFFQLGADAAWWQQELAQGGPHLQARCKQAAGFDVTPGTWPQGAEAWPKRYGFVFRPGRPR